MYTKLKQCRSSTSKKVNMVYSHDSMIQPDISEVHIDHQL